MNMFAPTTPGYYVIPREFAGYITKQPRWNRQITLVYQISEAGELYIGGHGNILRWSIFQFPEDVPSKIFLSSVITDETNLISLDGFKTTEPTANPLEWVIARSERQLMEHWQSLQQVKE